MGDRGRRRQSPLKWIGCELAVNDDVSVLFHQRSFTNAISVKAVSPDQRKNPAVLTGNDPMEIKSCLGILQFLANNTRRPRCWY